MIKVFLDPQTFITQEFGGISRYFTELCIEFQKDKDMELFLSILYTDNIHYLESSLFNDTYQQRNAFLIKYSKLFRYYLPRKLKKKSIAYTINLIKKQDYDLFVPTYYDPYFLPHLGDKPFVLTVHDMIHELYPQYFEDDLETVANKKKLIKEATKIIAVSENTKKDILRIYPETTPDKIEVVYLAHHFSTASIAPTSLPDHYLLFVGNRNYYKNFTLFVNAISPLFRLYPDLFLVCAGGNPFDDEELSLLQELDIYPRVTQQNFKDTELKFYYENARCFVFPSAYEGFGIPILEAMSAGCPIILTDNSSFPEIAGEAGIYFELNNEIDLREKVDSIWNSEQMRIKYKQKGFEQAQKFTWQRTAKETLNVYKKALELQDAELHY